jgi:multicomponent Na+:H+ antiporter subunit D
LQVVIFLGVLGFGAKAGMFPLQSWLPTAHPVAPSNASSVLSGVITKAGVFVIIRIIRNYTLSEEIPYVA